MSNNFKPIPSQTLRVTSSYTIPNGFYAQVEFFFLSNASGATIQNITLNGTVVLSNNGYQLSSTGTVSMTGVGTSINADYTTSYLFTPYNNNNSGREADYVSGSVGFYKNYQMPKSIKVWLRQGDVINGTNFGANVQLFVGDYGIAVSNPFNFLPAATVVQSSSYTIPTGKYALVTHYFMYQSYNSVAISNYPSVNNLTVNGITVALINNMAPYPWYKGYDDKNAVEVTYDYSQKNRNEGSPTQLQYWAKAGDIINGAGNWRAIISLYSI